MSSKQAEQEGARQVLVDALNRIEIYDCCTARREAEQILKNHPELQSEYRPFILDYKLNLNPNPN